MCIQPRCSHSPPLPTHSTHPQRRDRQLGPLGAHRRRTRLALAVGGRAAVVALGVVALAIGAGASALAAAAAAGAHAAAALGHLLRLGVVAAEVIVVVVAV